MSPRRKLSAKTVQAVIGTITILDVASRHTKLKAVGGGGHVGRCPIGGRSCSYSGFRIDPARQTYYCSSCGAKGNALDLHMLLTGDTREEAVRAFADEME